MPMKFWAFLPLFFAIPSFAAEAPHQNWQTLHLPHFDLIYDAEYNELAKIYAERLEGAYLRLSPLFMTAPDKTAVILQDVTDLTNGSAGSFPYPMISVYPVPPGPNDSISEYGDWASELVTHEYTHILAQSQRRGVFAKLEYVFGEIMTPNMYLPRWWHEGLAVESETRFSPYGRLRATSQDANVRSYVLANRLTKVDVSEANEVSMPDWPYGERPYLFGSLFWSELIEEKGPGVVKELSWAHAGHMPFFLNDPGESVFGQAYPEEFTKLLERVDARAKKQIQALEAIPPSKVVALDFKDREGFSPSISPDGLKMAFIGKDETSRRAIRLLVRPSVKEPFTPAHLRQLLTGRQGETQSESKSPVPLDGPPTGTLNRLSWFPDSSRIIYDRVDILNAYNMGSDLYSFDLNNMTTKRLSWGLRAREPAVSPSGKTAAYIQIAPGRTNLGLFDMDSQKSRIVYTAALQDRCSYPIFLNENEIAFSLRHEGKDQLQILDLRTKKMHAVLTDYPELHFAHDVNNQLFFISSKNGVANLYVANKDLTSARPVSHTLTGLADSDWDPFLKDYYLSERTDKGFQLRRLPASEAQNTPAKLPVIKPLFADRYANTIPNGTVNAVPLSADSLKPDDYSPWKYLLPRYWIPEGYTDAYSSYLAVYTGGSDPTSKHAWDLMVNYDVINSRFGYLLDYGYDNSALGTGFSLLQLQAYDLTYELPGYIAERTQFYHVGTGLELTGISPFLYAALGATYMTRNYGGYLTSQAGPNIGAYFQNFLQNGAQISPESGWGGYAMATEFIPNSNQLSYNQYEAALLKYWSGWLPARHVIMTKIQAFYQDPGVPSSNWNPTLSLPLAANTIFPQYTMRGYPTGEFQGHTMTQASLEYRFPLWSPYKGFGTLPVFFKRLHAAVVADGVCLDGVAYDNNNSVYRLVRTHRSYWDVGAEVHLDTTIFYGAPITTYIGVYQPLEQTLNLGPNVGLGLLL